MRVLAKTDPGLGDRLIKAHGRPAAAVAPEYYFRNPWSKSRLVLPQKQNSCLHVQRSLFEDDLRFVVVESGIDAKDDKTSIAHFTAGCQVQKIRRPMHNHDTNARCSRNGAPQCCLRRSQLVIRWEILRERLPKAQCNNDKKWHGEHKDFRFHSIFLSLCGYAPHQMNKKDIDDSVSSAEICERISI